MLTTDSLRLSQKLTSYNTLAGGRAPYPELVEGSGCGLPARLCAEATSSRKHEAATAKAGNLLNNNGL